MSEAPWLPGRLPAEGGDRSDGGREPRRQGGSVFNDEGDRFRRFGDDWGLMLVPGWLFTHDGKRKLLKGPRVGPLTKPL